MHSWVAGVGDACVFQLTGIMLLWGDADMDPIMIRPRLRRITGVSAILGSVAGVQVY